MAIALTRVGNPTVFGDKKVGVFDVALTGSYPAGGEIITPAACGMQRIEFALLDSNVAEVDLTGAVLSKLDYLANGNVALVQYQTGALDVDFNPKTAAEAYASVSECRLLVFGY